MSLHLCEQKKNEKEIFKKLPHQKQKNRIEIKDF